MYKLHKAAVHYGPSEYELHGLDDYQTLESFESLDVDELTRVVGQHTGFPRQFKKSFHNKMIFTVEEHDFDLTVPEKIFVSANGYTITWVKI